MQNLKASPSLKEFLNEDSVYIKPMPVLGTIAYMMFDQLGRPMCYFASSEAAFYSARQHGFAPYSVH